MCKDKSYKRPKKIEFICTVTDIQQTPSNFATQPSTSRH